MAIDQVLESLLRVPLFADLKPLQIAEIGRRAERCAFRRGDLITRAGEPGDSAFLILSGDVGCRAGDRGSEEPVKAGSLVGELAMLVDHAYGVTAVVRDWADCLKLGRDALYDQMRADPDMAERIANVIRGRLTLIAEELTAIEQLLMNSIARCQVPQALLPPPGQGAIAASLAQ